MRRQRLFKDKKILADAPPVVFLHIQKTAGSTFAHYLRGHFALEQVAPDYWGDESTLEGLNDKRLIHGHITLQQAVRLFPGAYLVTFLRNPVARAQSQYRQFHDETRRPRDWHQRAPLQTQEDVDFATRVSFDEFVLSDRPIIRGHLDNLQTFYLADQGLHGRPALEAAIRNLHTRIGFFGIQEHFASSIRLMHMLTESDRKLHVAEVDRNVSRPADIELSKKGRERLAEYTALDAELYAAARRIFWRSYLAWRLLPSPIRMAID